jgi:predicted anti-sigma-YlaC factor YlaD
MKCEDIRILLSALIDNELDPEQKKHVGDHLIDCAECRAEYARLKKLKEVTDSMQYFDLPDKLLVGYWHGIYNRIERGLGWIFLSVGAIILLSIGAWEMLNHFFLDPRVPLIIKIGVGAVLLGLIMLLVSVLRERFFSRAHDRYESEVEI